MIFLADTHFALIKNKAPRVVNKAHLNTAYKHKHYHHDKENDENMYLDTIPFILFPPPDLYIVLVIITSNNKQRNCKANFIIEA